MGLTYRRWFGDKHLVGGIVRLHADAVLRWRAGCGGRGLLLLVHWLRSVSVYLSAGTFRSRYAINYSICTASCMFLSYMECTVWMRPRTALVFLQRSATVI